MHKNTCIFSRIRIIFSKQISKNNGPSKLVWNNSEAHFFAEWGGFIVYTFR